MEKLANKIPIWAVNLITVVSGIITIITAFVGLGNLININDKQPYHWVYIIVIFALLFVVFIFFLHIRKYRQASSARLKVTSFNYHKLTHNCRDIYFDTMHNHKTKKENITTLTEGIKQNCSVILDNLCELMNDYTGQEVNACIKLVSYINDDEDVVSENMQDITLSTLCRSHNSSTERGNYEEKRPIKLVDNTDFLDIIDNVNGSTKNYFYKGNLKEYDQQLKNAGKSYCNTHLNWERFYIGTIVVPIQIQFRRLYYTQKNNACHVIGFLCVDSLSPNAFDDKQENFNVDTVKSYADLLYILLGQYKYYLKKINESS